MFIFKDMFYVIVFYKIEIELNGLFRINDYLSCSDNGSLL